MGKWKKALLRGVPARHWLFVDDCLVLRGPRGEETDVPTAHLIDESEMDRHYARLADKTWVSRGAIAELVLIAEGARS